MYSRDSANNSNRGGYLYESLEIAVLILTPSSKRRIVTSPSSVRVGACFYCPSVVSSREADCGDTIHHSLVMSGTPVRIRGRKSIGLHDPINNLPSAQVIFRETRCRSCDSFVG